MPKVPYSRYHSDKSWTLLKFYLVPKLEKAEYLGNKDQNEPRIRQNFPRET